MSSAAHWDRVVQDHRPVEAHQLSALDRRVARAGRAFQPIRAEGRAAVGEKLTAQNPYPPGSMAWHAWDAGARQGRRRQEEGS